ncbi:MAG: PKD domain-containing protein, partial [Flavobacterium sp.]
YPNLENSKSYFVGATISPFKSYRFYWQAEFVNSLNSYDNAKSVVEQLVQTTGKLQLQRTTNSTQNKNMNCEIPLLIRYNINNYVGIGTGLQANINASEKATQSTTIDVYSGQNASTPLLNSKTQSTTINNSFTNIKTGFLLDLTIGAARIGPSLGARYVLNFKENFNYIQLYGIWKF